MPDPYGNPAPYDPNSGAAPVYPAGFVENFGTGSNYTEPKQDVIYHTYPAMETFETFTLDTPTVSGSTTFQPHVQNLGFDEPVVVNWLEADTTNEP